MSWLHASQQVRVVALCCVLCALLATRAGHARAPSATTTSSSPSSALALANDASNSQPQPQQQIVDGCSMSSQANGQLIEAEVECSNINSEHLHDLFNYRTASSRIVSLGVRDSNLSTLNNLPHGVHELRKLSLVNTSIDLEVLKEGSESLVQLSTLEISNEKISNIPQNFFKEMSSLKDLRLENDEIASLDADAFFNLDDSLENLVLRSNRFNRFPIAVKNLAQLQVLDLLDNDIVIDTQDYDLPNQLESLLQLKELRMTRLSCTCDFSRSPFYEWIVKTHIAGVKCNSPENLRHQEIIALRRDELCETQRSSSSSSSSACLLLPFSFHFYRLLSYVTSLSTLGISLNLLSKHCTQVRPKIHYF